MKLFLDSKSIRIVFLNFLFLITAQYYSFSQAVIDYTQASLDPNLCNVFALSSPPKVSNIQHYPVSGGVKYDWGKNIILKSKKGTSQSTNLGTAYAIAYGFKKNTPYSIKIEYSATDGAGTTVNTPDLTFSLLASLPDPGQSGATDCGGVSENKWTLSTGRIINKFSSYVSSPNTLSFTPDADGFNYLSISATGGSTSENTVSIRKITITDLTPALAFAMVPASVDVPCGFPLTQTFTVNKTAGTANITGYVWNLGVSPNGWLYNGSLAPASIPTTSNSITLVSDGSATVPKAVSVTPQIDNATSSYVATAQVGLNACPTITPTTVNLVCNQATPTTFTVNNIGNIPGITGYVWDLGTLPTGWKYNGSIVTTPITTTTNTIQLTNVVGSASANNINVKAITGSVTSNFNNSAIVKVDNCPCTSIGMPSNLSATFGTFSSTPGYYLNFTPASPSVGSYALLYYDVTTNTPSSSGINIGAVSPNNFFYVYYVASPTHTWKYRLAAIAANGCTGSYSAWSPDIIPAGQSPSCANGPLSSSLSFSRNSGAPYATLSWPTISTATQYQVQYVIFNTASGVSQLPVTVTTSTAYKSITIPTLTGAGWSIHYKVSANCSGTFGNYSSWSPTYFLQ